MSESKSTKKSGGDTLTGTGNGPQVTSGTDQETGGTFASQIDPPAGEGPAKEVADSPRADQPAVVLDGPNVSGTEAQVAEGARVQQALAEGDYAEATRDVAGASAVFEAEAAAVARGRKF